MGPALGPRGRRAMAAHLRFISSVWPLRLYSLGCVLGVVQGRVGHRDWYPGLKEATWRVMWTQLLFDPLQVTSVAARILAITYGFFCVILVGVSPGRVGRGRA